MDHITRFIQKNQVAFDKAFKYVAPILEGIYEQNRNGKYGLMAKVNDALDKMNLDLEGKITCSKGCVYCCYDDIGVTKFEIETILNYVRRYKIKFNRELLATQNSEANFMKLKYADRRCAALDDEGSCTIYPVRPMICRVYNSTGDPKECDSSNGPVQTKLIRIVEQYATMLAVIVLDDTGKPQHLHKIL